MHRDSNAAPGLWQLLVAPEELVQFLGRPLNVPSLSSSAVSACSSCLLQTWAGLGKMADGSYKIDLTLKAALLAASMLEQWEHTITIYTSIRYTHICTCHGPPPSAHVVPPPTGSELLRREPVWCASVLTRYAEKLRVHGAPTWNHGGGDKRVSLQDCGAWERDPRNHRLRKVQTTAVLSGRVVGNAWPGGREGRWNQSFKAAASRRRHDDPERG